MQKIKLLIGIFVLFCSCSQSDYPGFTAVSLRCNNLVDPAGVERYPEFSWIVSSSSRGESQTAYQIILDENAENLRSPAYCKWNSGKVLSTLTGWKISAKEFVLKVKIPANCDAVIEMPQTDPERISENGSPVKKSVNVSVEKSTGGKTILKAASGEYIFRCPL